MKTLNEIGSIIIRLLFSTQLHLMIIYRTSRWLYLNLKFAKTATTNCARHIMRIYTSCDISPKAIIGKGLSMPHPIGIVIGDGVIIGDDVKIWQQTTIGSHGKKGKASAYPVIGNRVRIYTGATIIGGITIGDDAVIGAHTLVTIDVPASQTAAGCPAVILKSKNRESEC